ncbi:Hsp90 co-chaperone Cdc37 [Patellaria atrata CBS 101060]|uniref:Hsp90 chaperone protein kinase-targeting subunit n=1 Tax=Patellaria atrata CBS 101060 TaxID=1346257 RepID=A0A9P4SK53_9PEZI|nr:Hsp90 co-chaperone Cdc37 [Patellaria atrata CBS 101060]
MPVDYSKWDALELSDDSDIEVHPNVDKRSFIRAKQNQIHQERQQRRHQITTLKYERIINDGLLERIDNLLTALKSHRSSSESADEIVFQALIESAGDPVKDKPPTPPEGVHQHVKEQPTFSKMMAALIDQVKTSVDEAKQENRLEAFIGEVEKHRKEVEGLQGQLIQKLASLEKEERKHITSDDIHTGFDFSNVSKTQELAKKPTETVELLNPGAEKRDPLTRTDTGQSSGADADVEEAADDVNEDSMQASKLGKEFAKIKAGDYRTSLEFIQQNPPILKETETDGLLVEAFNSQMDGKDNYARQCVHQGLLIQYCRQLGRDGVALFFKRITTKDHQAQKLFIDDVNSTYARIRSRTAEILKERAENPASGDVEQIQLHAVNPGTSINIAVPPPITPDSAPPQTEEEQALYHARQIFDSFTPGLQRALESGKLDEVNKVLGKMSVSEAEEVVEKLSEGGMLSLEQGVIDATTDEGKKTIEEIERTHKMPESPKSAEIAEREGAVLD